MKWILVGIIAVCNTLGDVLNTAGMKRQGEIEDLRPGSMLRMVGPTHLQTPQMSGAPGEIKDRRTSAGPQVRSSPLYPPQGKSGMGGPPATSLL